MCMVDACATHANVLASCVCVSFTPMCSTLFSMFHFNLLLLLLLLFCFVLLSLLRCFGCWWFVVFFLQSYRQGIILCVARLADGTVRIDFSLFQTADSLVSNGMQNLLVAISEQYSFRLFRSLNQSYFNWPAKLWLSILLIC